jgi:hypothetical protein
MELEEALASSLADHLKTIPAEVGVDPDAAQPISAKGEGEATKLAKKFAPIIKSLVAKGMTSGADMSGYRYEVEAKPLSGGNTAGLVATATLHVPFILKLDEKTPKLATEGLLMRQFRMDSRFPLEVRNSFPQIFAVREEPPYCYVMEIFPREAGYISLEDRLYPKPGEKQPTSHQVQRFVDYSLSLLLSAYKSSVDRRTEPNLFADYVSRISERLKETSRSDPAFASRELSVNGRRLPPWAEALKMIHAHEGKVRELSPHFTTYVHGDPNPGNLILREVDERIEVKQIDPKEWATGDYLFDVTKLTHFLEGTGPAEKPASGQPPRANLSEKGGRPELTYDLQPAPWTKDVVDAIKERVAAFAGAHGDKHWELRYALGMASNLLGLPLARLGHGRRDAALILYGEGLLWLDEFCTSLGISK